jgi:23S rRNA-intervening sequence protein
MGEIKTFRDLHAWQVGMDTIVLTYEVTADFPSDERFGLVSQMRRAAVSVPSTVERRGRPGRQDAAMVPASHRDGHRFRD